MAYGVVLCVYACGIGHGVGRRIGRCSAGLYTYIDKGAYRACCVAVPGGGIPAGWIWNARYKGGDKWSYRS